MSDKKREDPIRDFESTLLRKLKEEKKIDYEEVEKHEQLLRNYEYKAAKSRKDKYDRTIQLRREINELVKKQHNKTSQKRKKEIEKLQKIKKEHQETKNIYSPFVRAEKNKLKEELGFKDYDLYITDGFEDWTMTIKELLATGRPDLYLLRQYKKHVSESIHINRKLSDEEWKKIFKNTEKKDWLEYTGKLLNAIQNAINDLEGNRDIKDTESGYIRIVWDGNSISLEFCGWGNSKPKTRKKSTYIKGTRPYRAPWNKGKTTRKEEFYLNLDDDEIKFNE